METILTVVGSILVGFGLGVIGTIAYGIYRVRQLSVVAKKLRDSKEKEGETLAASVTERLSQVQKMTQAQFALLAQIDEPSKNALHSKYKNNLSSEIKQIEEEKASILKSILKDGYDPTITFESGGKKEQMKLSAYLKKAGIVAEESVNSGGKKVGKFVVYDCGSDGMTH